MMLHNTLKTSNNQTGIPPANHQRTNDERTPPTINHIQQRYSSKKSNEI